MTRLPKTIHEFRNAVLSKHGPPDGVARAIAVTLAQLSDGKSMQTFAGIPLIAETSGFCERTVRAALKLLRSTGWIAEQTKGRGHPVMRTLMITERTPAADAAPPRQEMPHPTPANGASLPRQMAPDTPAADAAYLDKNLDKNLGAAAPSPAGAGSAAPKRKDPTRLTDDELYRQAAVLRRLDPKKWTDAKLLSKYSAVGMTWAHVTDPRSRPSENY